MKKINEYLLLFLSLWFISCSEELTNQPIVLNNEIPPALDVDQLDIRSIGGGAVIYYKLPIKDILAVEARYERGTGKKCIVRSSALSDSVVIEGYMDTIPRTVELYTVTKSEVYSNVTIASIQPGKAPLIKILESLQCKADFGGMQMTWKNEDEAPVAVFVSQITGDDTLDVSAIYSKQCDGLFTVRGLESEESTFLIRLRDKFQNFTDFQERTLTPLYEKELDYSKFVIMSGSFHKNNPDYMSMGLWWDDSGDPGSYWPWNDTFPWYSSVDMGKPIKLSRFVIWQYGWAYNGWDQLYSGGNGRTWNIYGSNNPSPDMENWDLIMTCEITKPSGTPINTGKDGLSEEDWDVALNRGHEFMVPLSTPTYRYIRIEGVRSFGGAAMYGAKASEFEFFGDDR